jgi:hypothetical protein
MFGAFDTIWTCTGTTHQSGAMPADFIDKVKGRGFPIHL